MGGEWVAEIDGELIEVLTPLKRPFEIIFIDDGSTDGTKTELATLAPARVISFSRNFGKSQALQAGFDAAEGETIFTLDGDLQDDPHEIPAFLRALEHADLVVGWKQHRADPLGKRFFSKIANRVTRLLTGVPIHDMNCCFKAYRKAVAKSLRLYGDMHRYIPAIASGMGFSVTEIPVHHRERKFGKSKYGLWRLFAGFFDFFTLIFLRRFTHRPMHFFGLLGMIAGGIGFIILCYLTWIKLFSGALIGNRPLLTLGVFLIIVGFQSFSLGLIGELIIRQAPAERRSYIIKSDISK